MNDLAGTRLAPIVADVRRRADARRRKQPLERLEELVRPDSWRRQRFLERFERGRLAFVCEMKRRSPSAGVLLEERGEGERARPGRAPAVGARWFAQAQAYLDGGAAALSVLTEEDHFGGSLDDLRAVEFTRLPRLRKDFLLDAGMVWESALWGAEAILLLASVLDDGELAALRGLARELGLAVLVEAHDERELDRALALEPELVGVNARDLGTLEVDLGTVERLLPRVPPGPLRVAESGLSTEADVARVRAAGADAVLVGEGLLRAADPAALLARWREVAVG